MAGDAATKAAGKVNPNEDQLNQIDQPAEDNTWHEAPDLSKQNLRSQIDSRNPIKKQDVDAATKSATGTTDPNNAAATAQEGRADPHAAVGTAKQNISSRMNEDDKERLRQYREKTNNYFKGKFPKERKDQVIFRLKKMIVEVQTHRDCKCFHTSYYDTDC